MPSVYGPYNAPVTARDKIVSLITTLQAAGVTISPWFTQIRAYHNIADLQCPAVSVDFIGTGSVAMLGPHPPVVLADWTIPLSIRVHTSFTDDAVNHGQSMNIATSIVNYLLERPNLGDEYRLMTIDPIRNGITFDESASVGAEIIIGVNIVRLHQ